MTQVIRQRAKAVAFALLAATPLVATAGAVAQSLDSIIQAQAAADREAAAAQERIGALNDKAQDAAAQYRQALADVDSLTRFNAQLDKQVKLDLSGTLPQVLSQVAKQTGVPIEAQAQVWDLLPWGRETTVTAKIENQTLREALTVITKRLGLTYALKDEVVELVPMPPLRRLGRKSNRAELEALHAETRRRRNRAAHGSEEHKAAIDLLGRIEIEIARIERAMDPPRV